MSFERKVRVDDEMNENREPQMTPDTGHCRIRVLVVDEDPKLVSTICRGLHLFGHACVQALQPADARNLLENKEKSVDLLLIDLTKQGREGFRLIERLHKRTPELPVIAFAGLGTTPELETARGWGIRTVRKPFDPAQLNEVIRELME